MDPAWLAGIGGLALALGGMVTTWTLLWREQVKGERQRLQDALTAERNDHAKAIEAERAERAKLIEEFKANTATLGTLNNTVKRLQWGVELVLNQRSER